jgi:hypothetical protein
MNLLVDIDAVRVIVVRRGGHVWSGSEAGVLSGVSSSWCYSEAMKDEALMILGAGLTYYMHLHRPRTAGPHTEV